MSDGKKSTATMVGDVIGRAVPIVLLVAAFNQVDGWLHWAILSWLAFVSLCYIVILARMP